MALNIPMPGLPGEALLRGIDTGSSMFQRLMQPILNRENQQLQRGIHKDQNALNRERYAQLGEQFQKELALKQQQEKRLGANMDLQRALMQQNLLHAQHLNDPMYEFNNLQMLMGGAGGGMNQQQPPNSMMGEGMGMYSPEGLQGAQAQAQNSQQGYDPELVRRAYIKMKTGIDPLAPLPQTPEQRNAAALELFRQKEAIKSSNKTGSGEALTAPIKTKYQNVIGGVTSARPIIQKLIEDTEKGNIPGQAVGALFKPNSQANYKSEISTLLDGIRNAYTIPNTDSGTGKAEDKVLRKKGETDTNYAKRLKTILAQMDSREKDARAKLNAGSITAQVADDNKEKESNDPLGIR